MGRLARTNGIKSNGLLRTGCTRDKSQDYETGYSAEHQDDTDGKVDQGHITDDITNLTEVP